MSQQPTGFRDLLNAMMKRRWFITALVLGGFMLIMAGMFTAIGLQTPMAAEWKNGLAWVLIGGLISSMFLTSILVPVMYYIVDAVKFRIQRRKNKQALV